MSHSIKKLTFSSLIFTHLFCTNKNKQKTNRKNIIINCIIFITALHWVNILLAQKLLHSIENTRSLGLVCVLVSRGTQTQMDSRRRVSVLSNVSAGTQFCPHGLHVNITEALRKYWTKEKIENPSRKMKKVNII